MILIKLFFEFFKIGLFAVGGGLATLPFLKQLAENYGWINTSDLVDMIAISESTPGAIGINTATFVGYKAAGVLGGIITTLGLVMPSIIIILIIAKYFKQFRKTPIVEGAFLGIRPAVTGLIASVAYSILSLSIINPNLYTQTKKILDLINFKELILFVILIFLIHKYKKNPILYLLIAALVGIIFKL